MINYKGYVCEVEFIPQINTYMWHIKKDNEYVKTYLVSLHACKCYISKLRKEYIYER